MNEPAGVRVCRVGGPAWARRVPKTNRERNRHEDIEKSGPGPGLCAGRGTGATGRRAGDRGATAHPNRPRRRIRWRGASRRAPARGAAAGDRDRPQRTRPGPPRGPRDRAAAAALGLPALLASDRTLRDAGALRAGDHRLPRGAPPHRAATDSGTPRGGPGLARPLRLDDGRSLSQHLVRRPCDAAAAAGGHGRRAWPLQAGRHHRRENGVGT